MKKIDFPVFLLVYLLIASCSWGGDNSDSDPSSSNLADTDKITVSQQSAHFTAVADGTDILQQTITATYDGDGLVVDFAAGVE